MILLSYHLRAKVLKNNGDPLENATEFQCITKAFSQYFIYIKHIIGYLVILVSYTSRICFLARFQDSFRVFVLSIKKLKGEWHPP